MKWYSKYLNVYEKPFEVSDPKVIEQVKKNIQSFVCERPLASIVIIAHNESTRLLSCLWSLSDNQCRYPIEFIGVDNHSIDGTGDIYRAVGVPCYYEERKSPGHARNCGLQQAKGKYCLCIDSDTLYPPAYIQTMIEELEKPGIVAVSGLWSFIPTNFKNSLTLKLYEFFRDLHLRMLFRKCPELVVRGMVFGHDTEYAKKIGYKVNIKRGEDGAMAMSLKPFGKIKLLRKRKARPVTGSRTLSSDGSLMKSFWVRVKKALRSYKSYFVKKDFYQDQDYNLINKPGDPPASGV